MILVTAINPYQLYLVFKSACSLQCCDLQIKCEKISSKVDVNWHHKNH